MRWAPSLQLRIAVAYGVLALLSVGAVSYLLVVYAQAGTRQLAAVAVLATTVAVVVSVAVGALVARRTSRSLRRLTEGARRLAEGDLEHRVASLSSDETRELAAAFNRMAASLRGMLEDLAAERQTLSEVLSTMADAVVVIRPGGEVVLLNPAAQDLLGISAADAEGRRFLEIMRDHDLQQLVARCLETGRRRQAEVETLPERRSFSAVASPLPKAGGYGVLLTLHDLTRIRQMETTRKEFVSNVSHELRTPLASVKAMVETLMDGALEDPEMGRDFLRRIDRDVDRMNAMVDELLDLSRLESNQVPLEIAPLDLGELFDDVIGEFQARAREKQVRLTAEPEHMPLVKGDRAKVRQVLVNLVDNALKFTPAGGSVTLEGREGTRLVEVRVHDTGAGISRDDLPHVFERFYKADRSRRDGGTGLGLAIVKHIVQAHGGFVRVQSHEGEGSTFTFSLRCVDS